MLCRCIIRLLLKTLTFNKTEQLDDLIWIKVSKHKIQEIATTRPKKQIQAWLRSHPAACLCILPLSCHASHMKQAALTGRWPGIVLLHSQGKCLGTPLPSVREDGEQNSSPEAQPVTPPSAKYVEVSGFLSGRS